VQTKCPDICDKVLAEERAARAQMEQDYAIGSQKRSDELAAFDALVKATMVEVEQAEYNIQGKDRELDGIRKMTQQAKIYYSATRQSELARIAADMAATEGERVSGLLDPLTTEEIGLLIQLTCQLAGEMTGSVKERTCVPLRLAGVDVGILWTDEAFKNASVDAIATGTDEARELIAELVYMNSQGEKVWSEKKVNKFKEKRRRLDDHYPGDDYDHDEDDHDYGHDDYEDEFEDDYEDYQLNRHSRHEEEEEDVVEEVDPDEEKGEEINKVKGIVERRLFSRPRNNFLARSESLVEKIEEFVKAKEEEAAAQETEEKEKEEALKEEKSETGEADAAETEATEADSPEETEKVEEEEEEPAFDPMAYNLVKSNLKNRQQAIRRGLQYGVSGYILVDAVNKNSDAQKARADLITLAVGTLMHSRASTEHVWRMLSSFLPELVSTDDASQTCASPLATICPAKTIERSGAPYPPVDIVKAGEEACSRAVDEINAAGCAEAATSDELPTNISDGYYGYTEIRPRGEDDPLTAAFKTLVDLEPSALNDLETKERELENEKKALEKQVNSLFDEIGGRDQTDSIKSELHGLKNTCHIVTEGKYDYEVCIYGKAAQKDKGSKSGGTGLGQWQGMTFDDETGMRTMKWEKGQKCWNGPERSATVVVTCGADTTLLSAEEPDTCQYALEMKSYIACDDAYFQKFLASR
jgi:hypothetical protein